MTGVVWMVPPNPTPVSTVQTDTVIDDECMDEAMKASGLATKRQTVEADLRLLVQLKRQERIRNERGRLCWEGNLERMRRDA